MACIIDNNNNKYKTYFTCEITLCIAQIVNTEQLQIVYPIKMVCFRYIIVNILHKGDNKDNNTSNNYNNYLTVKQCYNIVMMKFRQFLKRNIMNIIRDVRALTRSNQMKHSPS